MYVHVRFSTLLLNLNLTCIPICLFVLFSEIYLIHFSEKHVTVTLESTLLFKKNWPIKSLVGAFIEKDRVV